MLDALDWVRVTTPSGLPQLLERLEIPWQCARDRIPSPDPDDDAKLAALAGVQALARLAPDVVARLFLDEVTSERQPTRARAYAAAGHAPPRASRSHQTNTLTRVIAALDAGTGRVFHARHSRISLPAQVAFSQQRVAACPTHERLYVVLDNWPRHFHPDRLVAREPQEPRFPLRTPPNWPTQPSATARRRWGELHLPIQRLPLPTYAAWTNPIEKLWRKRRQELLHLHPWADDLATLRAMLETWLDQFRSGDAALRRDVGLGALG